MTTVRKPVNPSHAAKLLSQLNKERTEQNNFCDVTLNVEQSSIRAHKAVLASESKYFQLIFQSQLKESSVSIEGVSAGAMDAVLDYIYTGEAEINNKNVSEVIAAAHKLKLYELMIYCSEHLNVDFDNYMDVYSCGVTYAMTVLIENAVKFMRNNLLELTKKDSFKKFHQKDVLVVLETTKSHSIFSIKAAYEGIVAWVKYEQINRKQHLDEMIGKIELRLLPREYIEEVVMKEELLISSGKVQYLKEAMALQGMLQPAKPKYQFVVFVENRIKLFKVLHSLQWQILPGIPYYINKNESYSAVACGEFLYVITSKNIHRINLYDKSAEWEFVVELPGPQISPISAVYDGSGILIYRSNKQMERYDFLTNKMSKAVLMTGSEEWCSLFCHNGVVSLVQGNVQSEASYSNPRKISIRLMAYNDHTLYPLMREETFSVSSSYHKTNYQYKAAILDNEVFCVGTGCIECKSFSLKENKWKTRRNHGRCYTECDMLEMDGNIYFFGWDANEYTLQRYNNKSEEWSTEYSDRESASYHTPINIIAI